MKAIMNGTTCVTRGEWASLSQLASIDRTASKSRATNQQLRKHPFGSDGTKLKNGGSNTRAALDGKIPVVRRGGSSARGGVMSRVALAQEWLRRTVKTPDSRSTNDEGPPNSVVGGAVGSLNPLYIEDDQNLQVMMPQVGVSVPPTNPHYELDSTNTSSEDDDDSDDAPAPVYSTLWVDERGILRNVNPHHTTPTAITSYSPSTAMEVAASPPPIATTSSRSHKVPSCVCEVLVASMERANWQRALTDLEAKRRRHIVDEWDACCRSIGFASYKCIEGASSSYKRSAAELRQCEMAEEAHRAQVHDRWVAALNKYITMEAVARERVPVLSRRREGKRSGVREEVAEARRASRLSRLEALLHATSQHRVPSASRNGDTKRRVATPSTAVSTATHRPNTSGEMRRREARWASEATKAATSLRAELLSSLPRRGVS